MIDDEELLASVRELGERLRHALAELPGVRRGARPRADARLRARSDYRPGAADIVVRALREQRLVLNATGPTTVRLLPPLVIDEAQAEDAHRPPTRRRSLTVSAHPVVAL